MASVLKRLVCSLVALGAAGAALAQNVGEQVVVGDFALQGLAAQTLNPGHCGLFLWSKTERPVFILYATESPAQALVRIGGRDRKLARKTTSGESLFGHFDKQTFAGDKYSLEIELTYDRDSKMQDGALIQRGVLRSRDKAGAETILPVGGMIGCKKA
ncbi:MAG: hypothetical protein R3C46_14960 [Hyphomonadaceae bacterium]